MRGAGMMRPHEKKEESKGEKIPRLVDTKVGDLGVSQVLGPVSVNLSTWPSSLWILCWVLGLLQTRHMVPPSGTEGLMRECKCEERESDKGCA